jgi:hypothetical protein
MKKMCASVKQRGDNRPGVLARAGTGAEPAGKALLGVVEK